ncbi:MaoC/PaaZ C-terminal domain-containing protein [Pseudomonas sp. BO3-4]|uniref:MaoC/PaaZ C-terminal domain-containing protein n=1 Tax=Pseudomonas TaxID=286 RepID=UPI0015E3CEB8|nr:MULTISPECIES: MaoC/PaaZ C-terminal domain-containing protein [Pseudomonas]MBA1215882.1 hypothetical protein [Pseudomonas fulva]WPO31957.1 MaoC/PaaZ C-terminal domain-containing protein [Pseudomonas sp. BO3-4]
MNDKIYGWEDFSNGQTWQNQRSMALQQDEIIAFAKKFDPLIVHTDPELALNEPLGMHCASGVHTFALSQRMLCDALFTRTKVVAGHRIDCFVMRKPVVAGDVLSITAEVLETKAHHRREDCGWVTFTVKVYVEGVTVLSYDVTVLIGRRHRAG